MRVMLLTDSQEYQTFQLSSEDGMDDTFLRQLYSSSALPIRYNPGIGGIALIELRKRKERNSMSRD